MRELHCDICERTTLFELPPCQDGHGPDCPELVCTGCGAAVLVAAPPFLMPVAGSRPDPYRWSGQDSHPVGTRRSLRQQALEPVR